MGHGVVDGLPRWDETIKVARVEWWRRAVAEIEEHADEALEPAVDGEDFADARGGAREVREVGKRVVEWQSGRCVERWPP